MSDRTGLSDIQDIIANRRLSLFGHVRRLPEGTPAHDALRASIDMLSGITPRTHWKRNLGRPRHTWVRRVLADVQLSAQEAWTAAGDLVEWRALRSSADYAI